mmetsp:Transcript_4190/g.5890  ORF Transcript_4190/g.5890 Transcript_4190/m.5890 type:complete len:120 (-) Transcript_4190:177-536(-)
MMLSIIRLTTRPAFLVKTVRYNSVSIPGFNEVTSLTAKEYRMAKRMGKRKKFPPPCHYEFLDLMNALERNNFDDTHPDVKKAVEVCDQCYEEAEKNKAKRKVSTVNYHLSKYVRNSERK